jgi:hypothetical protein
VRNGEYGLGVDIGDQTISAAVCGRNDDGAATAEPLPLGGAALTVPSSVTVDGHGRVGLGPDGGTVVAHLMARIGVPAPVYAGDRPLAAADLAAAAVQRVRELAAVREGRPDAWTVLTVPPSWRGHRRAEFARALEAAGVPRFSLVSGAVAAVHHHVAAGDLPPEPTVAVYDLGAATVDTAMVGPTADEPLGHPAVPPAPLAWGGRDADDVVVGHVRRCREVPAGGRDAARALRAACVTAKEQLSGATVVDVDLDGADGPVRLTREELDEALAAPVLASVEHLADTVAAAGRELDALDAVVLAGGGVSVPLVAEALSGELGRPLVVAALPALTAALGAAALAADALVADAESADAPPASAGEEVVDPPAVVLLAADGPAPVLDAADARPDRRPRRLARTAAPATGAPSRPPAGPPRTTPPRTSRLRRGAVVAGAFLGLVIAPPTLAALLDADVTATPAGQGVAEAQDGDVVASGSVAIGEATVAPPTGDPPSGPGRASGPGRTATVADRRPAGTSLAAALGTTPRTTAADTPGTRSTTVGAVSSTRPSAPAVTGPTASAAERSTVPTAAGPSAATTAADPPAPVTTPAQPPPGTTPPVEPPPVTTEPPATSEPPVEPPTETPTGTPPVTSEPPVDPPADPPVEPVVESPVGTPTESVSEPAPEPAAPTEAL